MQSTGFTFVQLEWECLGFESVRNHPQVAGRFVRMEDDEIPQMDDFDPSEFDVDDSICSDSIVCLHDSVGRYVPGDPGTEAKPIP